MMVKYKLSKTKLSEHCNAGGKNTARCCDLWVASGSAYFINSLAFSITIFPVMFFAFNIYQNAFEVKINAYFILLINIDIE